MEYKIKCDEEFLSLNDEYYNKLLIEIQTEVTQFVNNEIIKELRLLDESNSIMTMDSDKISMSLKKEENCGFV